MFRRLYRPSFFRLMVNGSTSRLEAVEPLWKSRINMVKQWKVVEFEWSLPRGLTTSFKKLWKKITISFLFLFSCFLHSKSRKPGKLVEIGRFRRGILKQRLRLVESHVAELSLSCSSMILHNELDFLLLSSVYCLKMARELELIPAASFLPLQPIGSGPLAVFTDGSVFKGGLTGSFGIYAGLRSPLTCSVSLKASATSDTSTADIHYAEKIAIIYALKKIQDLGLDTRPVVIFTDDPGIIIAVEALKSKYREFNFWEKEPKIATEIFELVTRLYEIINKPRLTQGIRKMINSLIGRCEKRKEILFQRLHRALHRLQQQFTAAAHRKRLMLIDSLLIQLCPHCARSGFCVTKCSRQYVEIIYLLAKFCRQGCALVHVHGHSDILQNEMADFLAHLARERSTSLSFKEMIEESWESNRKSRYKRQEKRRATDYHMPVATVIPYEPRSCGKIEYPPSFPICEEVWNNGNGQLDDFFKNMMKSDELNAIWADSYLQRNWKDLKRRLSKE